MVEFICFMRVRVKIICFLGEGAGPLINTGPKSGLPAKSLIIHQNFSRQYRYILVIVEG